jgi:hypothetical protein
LRKYRGKWLEILQETILRLKTVAVMSINNPNIPMHRFLQSDVVAPANQGNLRFGCSRSLERLMWSERLWKHTKTPKPRLYSAMLPR